jgi:riboflavin kinase
MSEDATDMICSELKTGVYYGWVQIGEVASQVYPMVMSIGWNPYYKNERRSAVSVRQRRYYPWAK